MFLYVFWRLALAQPENSNTSGKPRKFSGCVIINILRNMKRGIEKV